MNNYDNQLSVVIPVYNEQDCIAGVLKKWHETLTGLSIRFRIHAYNDGSKDRTLEVLRRTELELGDRLVVHDKRNGGHGHTILTGYREHCRNSEWLFQIDSDDEMGPEQFAELWRRREEFDFLIGIREGRVQPLPRQVISLVSRLSVRVFYGKSVWDVNSPYRLMRSEVFEPVYRNIPERTFAPNVIISGMAAYRKLRCFELKVAQRERQTGEVSIRKWKLFKAAVKSFGQTVQFALTQKQRCSREMR